MPEKREKGFIDYQELIREILGDILKPWHKSTSVIASYQLAFAKRDASN